MVATFRSTLEQLEFRSHANSFCFRQPKIEFFVQSRVKFRHRIRFMAHPEVVYSSWTRLPRNHVLRKRRKLCQPDPGSSTLMALRRGVSDVVQELLSE